MRGDGDPKYDDRWSTGLVGLVGLVGFEFMPSGSRFSRRSSRTEWRHAAMIACALLSDIPDRVRCGGACGERARGLGGIGCCCFCCSIVRRCDKGTSSASSGVGRTMVGDVGEVGDVGDNGPKVDCRGLLRNQGSIDSEVDDNLLRIRSSRTARSGGGPFHFGCLGGAS